MNIQHLLLFIFEPHDEYLTILNGLYGLSLIKPISHFCELKKVTGHQKNDVELLNKNIQHMFFI